MTPAEWDTSDDPDAMLAAAGDRISDRKLLLFGRAAADRVRHLLPEFTDSLLPQIEAAADAPTPAERAARLRAAIEATGSMIARGLVTVRSNADLMGVVRTAAGLLRLREGRGGPLSLLWAFAHLWSPAPSEHRVSPEQAGLLRCVAGNPFAPPEFDPAWLTSDVASLAAGVYADAAFDRLPILADALQDAGCGDERLLAHLRDAGPHARGCWAVDVLLGKE